MQSRLATDHYFAARNPSLYWTIRNHDRYPRRQELPSTSDLTMK